MTLNIARISPDKPGACAPCDTGGLSSLPSPTAIFGMLHMLIQGFFLQRSPVDPHGPAVEEVWPDLMGLTLNSQF